MDKIKQIFENKTTRNTLLILLTLFALIGFIAIVSLFFPNQSTIDEDLNATLVAISVFQTMQASDTDDEQPSSTSDTESTPAASSTTSDATPDPNCNAAEFVSDISIPDDTVLSPDQSFTKTWRLRNIGTCTWTTEYSVILSDGPQMGAQTEYPLTAAVQPGDTVDISIDMLAPSTEDVYRNDWLLRDSTGHEFGIGDSQTFYVRIIVGQLTPEVTEIPGTRIEIPFSEIEGMAVFGGTYGTAVMGEFDDYQINGYLKFSLSSIPATAAINGVYFQFGDTRIGGEPFQDFGCLVIYEGDYFPIDDDDFHKYHFNSKVAEYCSYNELQTIKTSQHFIDAVQFYLPGSIEFILFFENLSNGDHTDYDSLSINEASLIVYYSLP